MDRIGARAAAFACAVAAAACAREPVHVEPASAPAAPPESIPPVPRPLTPVAAPSAPSPPRAAEDELGDVEVDLDVPGFRPARVFAPKGRGRLVVATHGAGGSPEDACARFHTAWPSAFVLCPRGSAMSRFDPQAAGFYYRDHHALAAELRAALAALDRRFGARVDHAGAVYAGFSQGATMGALALPEFGFTSAMLVEGGTDDWTVGHARAFHDAGGERVVFVCGRPACWTPAVGAARALERGGVAAKLAVARGAGHQLGGGVMQSILENAGWLVEAR